jgi:predicted Rossmann fold flavoprotein
MEQPEHEKPAEEAEQPKDAASIAETWDAVIVGAGAAGLMAAVEAAGQGHRTLLLEKNRKAGVKILMSGGTRCNVTQATDNRGIVAAFGPSGRFLHSALAAFGVAETLDMFHAEGVATKVEPTGKIFPESDKALDVLAALLRRVQRSTCELVLGEGVNLVERDGHGFRLTTTDRVLHARKLLVTTGGQSFPGCGTRGDGYAWAAHLGHTIVVPRPALVPITTHADWVRELAGITIPDVALRVREPAEETTTPGISRPGRTLAERRGSLLFAHFGLTGPVVLDVSRAVSGHASPQSLVLECDFLPGMTLESLVARLREQSQSVGKKQLGTLAWDPLPRRLCDALLASAQLAAETRLAELGQRGWASAAAAFKSMAIPISGTMGFKKAEVTAGGVALDEVRSSTLESKLVPNLYFAGEVLDLDGPIGGYNFQAAWSTGTLAGRSM